MTLFDDGFRIQVLNYPVQVKFYPHLVDKESHTMRGCYYTNDEGNLEISISKDLTAAEKFGTFIHELIELLYERYGVFDGEGTHGQLTLTADVISNVLYNRFDIKLKRAKDGSLSE